VLPSWREPYGTVYGEALAAGLPVVGWRAGNLPHLVSDGVEGVVLDPGDIPTLAAALDRLATGYRLRPDDTASAFANGWFRTGDLGRWTDSGRLEVLGRADDMIITGGLKVAPALVERVLTAQPGVLEACVLGVPDQEWGHAVVAAVVPADPAQPPRIGALLQAVRASAGRAATPKVVRFLDALPLRGPGKVDRQALGLTFAEPP